MSDKGITKRIEEHFQNAQFYEAQQLYKVLFHKFEKVNSFDKASIVLMDGIEKMFQYKQAELGNDLALCLLELFDKAKVHIELNQINGKTPLGKFLLNEQRTFNICCE